MRGGWWVGERLEVVDTGLVGYDDCGIAMGLERESCCIGTTGCRRWRAVVVMRIESGGSGRGYPLCASGDEKSGVMMLSILSCQLYVVLRLNNVFC